MSIVGFCAEAGNCIKLAPAGTIFALQAGGAYAGVQPSVPPGQLVSALGKWRSPGDITPQYQPRSLLSLTPGMVTLEEGSITAVANVTVTIESDTIGQKLLYYLPPNDDPFTPLSSYVLLEGTSQTTPTSATIQIALPLSGDSYNWRNSFNIAYYDPKLPTNAQLPAFTFAITRAEYTVDKPVYACFNSTTGKFSNALNSLPPPPNAIPTQACWSPEPPNPTPYPYPIKKGIPTGAIIGISIGAVLVLVLSILLIVYGIRS